MSKKKPGRSKHIPQRTCIACRQKTDKRRLTRLVNTDKSGVLVDLTGKRNGRGAYVCDQTACWDKILNSPLLNKALKTEISAEEKASMALHKPAMDVASGIT
ncbi:MAG: YlxR family protein [Chloroflexi bacterium]|nr:YlxR family protein [Chloroflexota bacterium]